jgi:hypothetical protein
MQGIIAQSSFDKTHRELPSDIAPSAHGVTYVDEAQEVFLPTFIRIKKECPLQILCL